MCVCADDEGLVLMDADDEDMLVAVDWTMVSFLSQQATMFEASCPRTSQVLKRLIPNEHTGATN